MGGLKVGDIVARKSYGLDIFFKVVEIKNTGHENVITLKGITYRIEADAPESDLILQSDDSINEYRTRSIKAVEQKFRETGPGNGKRPVIRRPLLYAGRGYSKKALYRDTSKENTQGFPLPGKVLHIDGDEDYLETCLKQYKKLGITVTGVYIPEKDQPQQVYRLLQAHKPDILVLTGHDGVIKGDSSYSSISNYRNSKYFIDSVKEARRYQNDLDSLVIFAGACQSLYDQIIKAGANYASSPYRILIHALDPVFICHKVAFTNINKIIDPNEVIKTTITGVEGIGGIQTRGKYREGFPVEPYRRGV